MTTEECIAAIGQHVGQWGWYLDSEGAIRVEISEGGLKMCPLTALMRFETGKPHRMHEVYEIATSLAINNETIWDITKTADNLPLFDTKTEAALLQACRIFV